MECMERFIYVIEIEAPTRAHADAVIGERVGFDEDLGFPYTIDLADARLPEVDEELRDLIEEALS